MVSRRDVFGLFGAGLVAAQGRGGKKTTTTTTTQPATTTTTSTVPVDASTVRQIDTLEEPGAYPNELVNHIDASGIGGLWCWLQSPPDQWQWKQLA